MADNQQAQALSIFIQLEKEARESKDPKTFAFTTCNNSKRLIPYHQAIFWRETALGVSIQAISATSNINKDAPYVVWLNRLIKEYRNHENAAECHRIKHEALSDDIRESGEDWLPEHLLWCPFVDAQGEVTAGLILTYNEDWPDNYIAISKQLISAYQHAWFALITPAGGQAKHHHFKKYLTKKRVYITIAAVIFIFCLPIRQTVLAPAEIAAHDPTVISSPLDGVIEKLFVEPNQQVKSDEILFNLDPITIRNRHDKAMKALQVAEEKLRKAYQHAFTKPESKAELSILRAEVDKEQTEVAYTKELLDRVSVKSNVDGIAIYSDPKDWIGKPVKTGERVMLIANPQDKELDIQMPVSDAISLESGSTVKVFLNVAPLSPIKATLRYASYTAAETPEGVLAYSLKADFNKDEKVPRIGLKGTAKVYGSRVTLFYFIFWKPISYLRRTFGI